jgi:hypothetical protein
MQAIKQGSWRAEQVLNDAKIFASSAPRIHPSALRTKSDDEAKEESRERQAVQMPSQSPDWSAINPNHAEFSHALMTDCVKTSTGRDAVWVVMRRR